MTAVVTSKIQPTVNSSRSDIGRSGLMRSNVVGPQSGITTGLINWRKSALGSSMEWRNTAGIHRVYPNEFGMYGKAPSDILILTGAFWEME